MHNARDTLFINRMAELVTSYELIEFRNKGFFIRNKSRKIDNKTVLTYAFCLMKAGLSWENLQWVTKADSGIHYQTVYKRYMQLHKFGALKYAWEIILKRYVSSRLSKNAYAFKDLYIDTTTIKNIGGTDCTGRNPTDRGRQGSKVSVLIDEFKVALSEPVIYPANVHDSKTIEDTIENVPFNLVVDKRSVTRIGADKAYNGQPLFKRLIAKKVRVVTEPKAGVKNPIPVRQIDLSMFKKRVNIEHFFGIMKRFKRIRFRADRFVDNYKSFWYFAMARRTSFELNDYVSNSPASP